MSLALASSKPFLFSFIFFNFIAFSRSTLSPPLDMVYLETRVIDNIPEAWSRFSEFVLEYQIPHIAVGILDLGGPTNKKICDVSPDSYLVNNFLKNLNGSGIRVSIHPYDGFGDPRWPINYKAYQGLPAVMRYIYDLRNLLKKLNINVEIIGVVVGESMGGKPFRGDAATVQLFRKEALRAGLGVIKIGAAAGDILGMGLDELYTQIYDWTFYDESNPNFWETYKDNPNEFFKVLQDDRVQAGWNTDGKVKIPPWSELKNYYNKNSGVWKWEISPASEKIRVGQHYMVAMSVPKEFGGLQDRLEAWRKWDGVISFFREVKIKSKFKFALYMDEGLEYFV